MIFWPLSVFLFGTIIGSFLNVVIFRLHTGRTVLGRSMCFSCGIALRPLELIPLVGFFFLKGRCRHCRSRISLQYPIVEALTGIVFLLLFYHLFPGGHLIVDAPLSHFLFFFLTLALWSVLLVIFFYDLRHKIIPDLLSLLFFLLALFITGLSAWEEGMHLFWNHVAAAVILGGFFFLLWFFSRGRWMGFGDVKLALGIGMYLGLSLGLSAFAYAFWIGAGYSIAGLTLSHLGRVGTKRLSLVSEPLTMKSEVPFAPFLIVGTFLSLWFQSDIFHLNFFL